MACWLVGTLFTVLAATGILPASNWWEKKPFMEWSVIEARELLYDSPWVGFILVGFRTETPPTPSAAPPSTVPGEYRPNRKERIDYCVRLLTARTIREAMLRFISLGSFAEPVVKAEDLKGRDEAGEERARLAKFLSTRPDDVRVKGDAQNIIIGITIRTSVVVPGMYSSFAEDVHPEAFIRLSLSDLASVTQLVTNGGSRARLTRYEPPDTSQLGARFYFPRTMSDGSPLIKPNDKELRFETHIQGRSIKIEFDLGRMTYKGKLEI